MATGDEAAAAGLLVYTGNENANELWVRDNERGDELARVKTAVIPLARGGTGATTAAGARAGLGIPESAGADAATPYTAPLYNAFGRLVSENPATPYDVATKGYVDAAGTGLPTDPSFSNVHVTGGIFNPSAPPATSNWSVMYHNGADGRLCRGSSSRRWKTQIRSWHPDPEGQVLNLKLRQFRWKASLDPTQPVGHGLIAEEVASLPGLSWLVSTDSDGQVDGVQYERLALALLPLVKDLAARVAALEAGLT